MRKLIGYDCYELINSKNFGWFKMCKCLYDFQEKLQEISHWFNFSYFIFCVFLLYIKIVEAS